MSATHLICAQQIGRFSNFLFSLTFLTSSPTNINKWHRQCNILLSIYHQRIAAGLQRRQADTENHNGRKGVVVDESSAMSVAVASIEGQVGVGVSREEDGAEVDLEGDGLHSAVDADVPLSWAKGQKVNCILWFITAAAMNDRVWLPYQGSGCGNCHHSCIHWTERRLTRPYLTIKE